MSPLILLGALAAIILGQRRRSKDRSAVDEGWDDDPSDDHEVLPQANEHEYPCWLPPKRPDPSSPGKLPAQEAGPAGCELPQNVEPKPLSVSGIEVPFAVGSSTPVWPVQTKERHGVVSYVDVRGRCHGMCGNRFGATRRKKGKNPDGSSFLTGEERYHVGVDLGGRKGDLVVAMEPGKIVAIQPFTEGTWAILEETDTGIVVLYGEVAKGSWNGRIAVGDRVEAGQPIAKIGLMGTKDMLHVETYIAGTRGNLSWNKTKPARPKPWERWGGPPPEILDPTRYLLLASLGAKNVANA